MINVIFGPNVATVTLKDRIDISPVFLVMSLKFMGQNDFIKELLVVDTAGESCRYNDINFELVNEVDEDLALGKVYLIPGNYAYKIYQNEINTIDTSGKLLESGILRFGKEVFTDKTLESTSSEKTLL